MKKTSVYLDTSVISYFNADDTPEKMQETIIFWDIISKSIKYEVYISTVTLAEIDKCLEPKRSFMLNELSKINYIELEPTEEIVFLTEEYLRNKILSSKSEDDLTHIAFAVANNIDYIISWNFKHFVNIKTIKMVNATNLLINYRSIEIITPSMIIGGENE